MPEPIAVPAAVAEQARAALAERARTSGIEGTTRHAVVCALELAQSPFVPEETLALVGAWHAANPNATTTDGRCTRLAGLYGGAHGRRWALDHAAIPAVSWLPEESATLEAMTAAPTNLGGMIALFPDDAAQFVMPGGDPAEELHVTLAFVSEDAATLHPDDVTAIEDAAEYGAHVRTTPLLLHVVGAGTLGDSDPPATVLFLQQSDGDGTDHQDGVAAVASAVRAELDDYGAEGFPAEHDGFIPHMTVGYGTPVADAQALVGRDIKFSDGPTVVLGDIHQTHQWAVTARSAAAGTVIAAGLAVVAMDTGRVLMLQRCLEDDDPAAGMWEFPGGTLDPGETPLVAARREFSEETGCACPGILAGEGWTSPDGVYRLFCHIVETEAEMGLNLDHEDRHVVNPDDPDGDLIEVLAWWDPEHAAENPALRPEAAWTPWDELASIAAIGATGRANMAAAAESPLAVMSQRAQRARARLQERTMAAAQVAIRDALRRAGAKVVQRAGRRSNAAKAAVAAAGGKWTPAVLAAVGITEQDLIRQAFDSLGEHYESWVIQAATEQVRSVAATLGLDEATVIARMQGRMTQVAAAARTRLNDDLTSWAYRLLAEPEPSFGDVGEVPVDPTLPLSILQPSLQIADGRRVASDGDPSGDGLLLEAWVTFDASAPIEVVTWTCGEPARPFPPHQDLCGTQSQWADYSSQFAAEIGDFPRGESYWFPGDHDGCQCDYDYSYISVEEAGITS